MQKLLVTVLLCTLGTLTLTACPGKEEFQAATGTAVNMPSAKRYNPSIDVTNGSNLDYEEDLVTSGQDDTTMDMNADLDVAENGSDINFDEMTQSNIDIE